MIVVITVAKLVMEWVKQIACSVRQVWLYNFLMISLKNSVVFILVMMNIQEQEIIVSRVILAVMVAMDLISRIVWIVRLIS